MPTGRERPVQSAVNAELQAAQGWAGLQAVPRKLSSILELASEGPAQLKVWTWELCTWAENKSVTSVPGAQWAGLMSWEGGPGLGFRKEEHYVQVTGGWDKG